MVIFILKDLDPAGGYYAAQEERPEKADERQTIVEVRRVKDFPEDVWEMALTGALPVDDDLSNDSTWLGWWPKGRAIWKR